MIDPKDCKHLSHTREGICHACGDQHQPLEDAPRVTVHGKELQLDGHHLADCISDEAAEAIAICLNNAGLWPWEVKDALKVESFFA